MIDQPLQGTAQTVYRAGDAIKPTASHSHVTQKELQYTECPNSLGAYTALTGAGGEHEGSCPVPFAGSGICLANCLEGRLIRAGDFNHFVLGIAGEVLLQKLEDAIGIAERGVLLYFVRLVLVLLVGPGCLVIFAAIPTREQPVQRVSRTGESGVNEIGGIGIFPYVFHVVIAWLCFHIIDNVPYDATDEGKIGAGSHPGIQVSLR